MKDVNIYWDMLIDFGIATEDELNLITSINGYNEDTLSDVLYVRTGYRDFDQFTDEFQPNRLVGYKGGIKDEFKIQG